MMSSVGSGFSYQLPSGLTTHEHAAHWPRLANLGADSRRAQSLVLRQIGEARSVALARMDHSHTGIARRLDHSLQRLDWRTGGVEVGAQAVTIAAVTAEVNRHVDEDEGSRLWVELATARPGVGERLHFLVRAQHCLIAAPVGPENAIARALCWSVLRVG